MQTHKLIQGTTAWHAHRANFRNASDSPAVMGESPYKTRTQLMHEKHTGLLSEFDAGTQRIFDAGHRFEALARPLAEDITGLDFYPVTGTEGKYSASFDGLTMDKSAAFEHKTMNAALYGDGAPWGVNFEISLHYRIQMEHQCMVAGCSKVLFMASRWAKDESLEEEQHCWYTPNLELRAQIEAAWEQFEADLAVYQPQAAAAPAITGQAPETLPALLITVRGEVTASNLAEFKETALHAIRSVNRELNTDQDFADADKAVKWCSDIEERVDGAKEHALAQTQTIDQLFKTMDDIKAEARQVRLDLGKLIMARKQSRKQELLVDHQTRLADHLRACNTRLGRDYMPEIPADFAGAIHGKKNFASMAAALDSALANAKIEANAVADKIDANLKMLVELATEHKFLFADTSTIVLKAPDDCRALVENRIAAHKAEAQRQADALAEKAREVIRAEEAARLEREHAEREAAATKAAEPAPAPAPVLSDKSVADANANVFVDALEAKSAAPNVVALPARAAPSVDTGATIKLGEINAMLAPIALTADGMALLGFPFVAIQGAAKLYRVSDLGHICAALVAHIEAVQARQAA